MTEFNKKNSQIGMSLLLPVLLLGAVGISVFLMISSSALGSLAEAIVRHDAVEAKSYLEGCLDEFIIQLSIDEDYSPGTLSFFDEPCALVVDTPAVGQRRVVIIAEDGLVTQQLTAVIQLSPLTILSITEP